MSSPSTHSGTRGAQAAGLARRATGGVAHRRSSSLAVVSGKGGVGKSLLAVNLALELTALRTRPRVLLVDGDAGLANADLLLGWVPEGSLRDALDGRCTPREAVTRGGGLELLVSGSGEHVTDGLVRLAIDRGGASPFGHHALRLFDLGAGIGRDVVHVATACERIWLVATPEPTSLADAYAMARRLFETRRDVRVELVVNRAGDAEEGARTHLALDRMTRRFLGRALPLRAILPDTAAVSRAVATQKPLAESAPKAAITRRIRLLAESVAEELAPAAHRSREIAG